MLLLVENMLEGQKGGMRFSEYFVWLCNCLTSNKMMVDAGLVMCNQ
jgi:hypothetical protein